MASDKTGDTPLIAYAKDYLIAQGKGKFISLIHFLDRPVSGVVLLAKSSKGASRLHEQFRERKVVKEYRAICHKRGNVSEKFLWEDLIAKDRKENKSFKKESRDDKKERMCILEGSIKEIKDKKIEFSLYPKTGRSHQLRVQLSLRGFPILGDIKYGSDFSYEHRIFLHAKSLEIFHPVTKEKLKIESPLPKEWQKVLND